MSWWPAIVLFGSSAFPLGYRLNWPDREQLGRLGAVALVTPILGLTAFDVVMLLGLRSPFAGSVEAGVAALGLGTLLVVTGSFVPRLGRRGATVVLIPAVLGSLPCAVLLGRGALPVDPLLTVSGVGGLFGITGLLLLRVIDPATSESVATLIPSPNRSTQLSLLFVALLVPAALVMHVPSTLDGAFCDDPGEYDVDDVRLSYERSTMSGSYGVYVHGRQVYYVGPSSAADTPVYRAGTVSVETVRRLMSVVERNGILCLNDQYTGVILLTEPISDDLRVSTGTASKVITVTPTTAAPPQVERTVDALRDTGRAQPRVNASRFCARLPADARIPPRGDRSEGATEKRSHCIGTQQTGTVALRTTVSVTLPIRYRPRPVRPCVPITMRSISFPSL